MRDDPFFGGSPTLSGAGTTAVSEQDLTKKPACNPECIWDEDKICSGTDDLIFYEGNYCTQNTVGSIHTVKWNGDFNNGPCVILFLKQIS